MSRSNPTAGSNPNPATRWFEWSGETGAITYYDKDAKQDIEVGSDFSFILLDQLGCVRGWHDASGSGIYSNEVRDTLQEPLVVKAFKGGTLAEGIYRNIRDRVNALGGRYNAVLYIAYKNDDGLSIAALRLKGAALNAWVEFGKAHKDELYKKAIRIKGFTEGKKGRITFRVPALSLKDISPDMDRIAIALDAELQRYLKSYFTRTKRDQADVHTQSEPEPETEMAGVGHHAPVTEDLTDDDIPF